MTSEEKRENLFSEALGGLVRVGTVTHRRMEERRVRVWFEDNQMSSGWLPVIISQDVTPDHEYDDPQWTEFETEDRVPQAGETRYVPQRAAAQAAAPWKKSEKKSGRPKRRRTPPPGT